MTTLDQINNIKVNNIQKIKTELNTLKGVFPAIKDFKKRFYNQREKEILHLEKEILREKALAKTIFSEKRRHLKISDNKFKNQIKDFKMEFNYKQFEIKEVGRLEIERNKSIYNNHLNELNQKIELYQNQLKLLSKQKDPEMIQALQTLREKEDFLKLSNESIKNQFKLDKIREKAYYRESKSKETHDLMKSNVEKLSKTKSEELFKNNQKLLNLKKQKSIILNKKTDNVNERLDFYTQELSVLITQRDQFIIDFKKYFADEVIKIENNTDKKLMLSKTEYLNELNNLTIKRQKDRKEFLIKNSNKHLKLLKREHKTNIKILKKELKTIKNEVTLLENQNKKETKEFISNQKQIRINAKGNIKNLKKNIQIEIDNNKNPKLELLFKEVKDDIKSTKKVISKQKRTYYFKKVNMAYLFVGPAAFGAIVFTILPVIFMIVASQFKIDIVNLGKSQFVGFYNFQQIFKYDVEFQKSLTNTLIYALITIGLLSVVTLGMAAWLSKNTKIHNAVTTMVFTPHIASLVSISILWIALLSPTGIINQLLEVFGITGPRWLLQENTSLFSVSMVTVWKDIGYYVLIIIAGLQAIPAYVYEAAKLDKSSKTKTFFTITVPLLTPTLSFVFVNKFINSFKVFAPIEIMTNGGPMGSSTVLSYWIYKSGRLGFNYGQAMSGAIILTLIITFFTILNFRFFNRKIQYT